MNFFNQVANLIPEYKELIKNPGTCVSGLSRVHKSHFIAALACEKTGANVNKNSPLLVLVESENEAMRISDDVNTLGIFSTVYPARDLNLIGAEVLSPEYEHKRISVLSMLIEATKNSTESVNRPRFVVISTPEAASQITFSPDELENCILKIKNNDELNIDNTLSILVENGYTRVDMVESSAQFSVRGSIIDIFPVNNDNPVRIDLWGDTVESITIFDTESQRSIEKIKSVKISPSFYKLENSKSAFFTLFNYVQDILVCEQNACNDHLNAAYEQLRADIELMLLSGNKLKNKLMLERFEYDDVINKKCLGFLEMFAKGESREVSSIQLPSIGTDYEQFFSDARGYLNRGYAIIIFGGTEKASRTLALELRDNGLPADYTDHPKKVYAKHILVVKGILSCGFDYPQAKCACFTQIGIARTLLNNGGLYSGIDREVDINSTSSSGRGKNGRYKTPRRKNKSETIRALSDIKVGDYIVHDNYGIGIFEGVEKVTTDGISKDYIKLSYAGKSVLFIPVTQLDFIARYIGNKDTESLKLSRLDTGSWQKTRAKAKKAVEELAASLIELYSKRMKSKGYSFEPDTLEQREFENRFGYIETDDQINCINQLKGDMQSPKPMERLLCGDVGFGKTEVALRGAFKCVMDGKQCVLLCPTTVLAWQHYQTALSRMGDFPINIELISRFRSPKEQKEILRKLKIGVIDFIIGTHTLVSNVNKFKNLGLVIIDEEQRFGVNQKEKFKEEFSGVDVLTLSATPIPRTLNMAMSGIRDMSVIESPPHDRMPVTTYVIEHDMGIIVGAINKELRRAGQVYYIHNRVDTIMSCAAKLCNLIPEARIGIAHGKMGEKELLDVWRRLLEREIDILVCTTLIETGVDVPNVNTLIIENADRMGLAQLHQLRGRVGRMNRRAYAYFTYAKGKVLSEIATKRLEAVREFTQFGAGFKIALRDLEIRGAGSVLGESQSGHLSSVGYETYVRLLEEAVTNVNSNVNNNNKIEGNNDNITEIDDNNIENHKNNNSDVILENLNTSCVVELKSDAFIPESYISNQSQRISCYKIIAEIKDKDDFDDVIDELSDRYGAIPKSVKGLLDMALIKAVAMKIGISEIVQKGETVKSTVATGKRNKFGEVIFYWENLDMKRISKVSAKYAQRLQLNLTGRIGMTLSLNKDENVIELVSGMLNEL